MVAVCKNYAPMIESVMLGWDEEEKDVLRCKKIIYG